MSGGCSTGGLDSPALQIRCFGQFEVLRDGVQVSHWRRDRARRLLKHLVVQRRPVAREAVLGLLWEDVDPTVASRHLRVVLHALRQAIGAPNGADQVDFVLQVGDQLYLNPAAPVWIDTDAFFGYVEAAEAFDRDNDGEQAAAAYSLAATLYRGDYLVDETHDHSIVLRREELKDRYQVVLGRLADYCLEYGDFMGCIAHCYKLLGQDLCREDAYLRLMYCHAALGQRSRALHWYRLCEHALQSELRIGPGERTRLLFERIVSKTEPLPGLGWILGDRRGMAGSRLP